MISISFFKPSAIQGHTLHLRCQLDNSFIFWKAIQFKNFISELIWIELKSDEISAMSIHFDNSTIIFCFYTNSTPKTIIYCFKNINCSFSNNNMVFWWFELGWLHCPRLVFIIKGQIQHIFSRRELQITRGNFDYCSINGFLNATWFFQKLLKISLQHCDSRFKSCLFICLCKCCQAPSPSP